MTSTAPRPLVRLLVIDLTRIGDGTASGEVKATLLAGWPEDHLLQAWKGSQGVEIGSHGAVSPDEAAAIVAAFAPAIVLYRPVPKTGALHRFAMELLARTNVPLALWIVDDWPAALEAEDPEQAALLDTDLRWLIERADVRFSISQPMSEAFEARYGRPFVPVANGIDPADWAPPRPGRAGELRVRYAGGLAENMTLDTVLLVAGVIQRMAQAGTRISLEIKTQPYWRAKVAERLTGMEHVTLTTSDLPAAGYRAWLADADALLIAYNFDARSRTYVQYSLANKLPECLASGAAVLAVGPEGVATIDTLARLDVAERITTADPEAIRAALERLVASPDLRLALGQRAQSVAFTTFDVRAARRTFDAAVGRVADAVRTRDHPRDLQRTLDEAGVVDGLLGDGAGARRVVLDDAGQAPTTLRDVPWDTRPPDAIQCAFDAAGTGSPGQGWRDIGGFLRQRGYGVYVSEWHPASRDGIRHDWRRIVPFTDDLTLDPAAWGNFLAFRLDPGMAAVLRATDARVARGGVPPLPERWRGSARRGSRFGRAVRRYAPALYGTLKAVSDAMRRRG